MLNQTKFLTQVKVNAFNKALVLSDDTIMLHDLEEKRDWLIDCIVWFEKEDMRFTAMQLRNTLVRVRAMLRDHREKMLKDGEVKNTT